uniref:Uncharacterized protein n=1 Tax=viral metagenome TaxID=1070528 RepID=A0A6M3ILG6_9ZZZZ
MIAYPAYPPAGHGDRSFHISHMANPCIFKVRKNWVKPSYFTKGRAGEVAGEVFPLHKYDFPLYPAFLYTRMSG